MVVVRLKYCAYSRGFDASLYCYRECGIILMHDRIWPTGETTKKLLFEIQIK